MTRNHAKFKAHGGDTLRLHIEGKIAILRDERSRFADLAARAEDIRAQQAGLLVQLLCQLESTEASLAALRERSKRR